MYFEGKVKWFNEKKGYGFIEKAGGKDIFVHQTAITKSGISTLKEGQKVKFEVTQGLKGEQAINVEVIGESKETTDEKIKAFRRVSKENLRDLKKRQKRR